MYVEGINKEIFILLSSVLDPSHFDVDPDQDPGIHLSLIVEKVDRDPGPKWIRIRVPIFNIFYKEIHVGQITILIFVTAKT